jgi:uncharacterized protein (UPF0332 family)
VTPETGYFFDKARKLLAEAEAIPAIKLYDVVGRTAYLAGFHAAQAFISERTGKSVKTHKGVHAELYRLTRDNPLFDPELQSFLSRNYDLKAIADYEIGPEAEVSADGRIWLCCRQSALSRISSVYSGRRRPKQALRAEAQHLPGGGRCYAATTDEAGTPSGSSR